jgi:CRP-like cAMP-binding protein
LPAALPMRNASRSSNAHATRSLAPNGLAAPTADRHGCTMPKTPATPSETRCQICAARTTCLVGQLPRPQQERLDPLIREHAFRKGETLMTEAAPPDELRTVKLGSVMLTRIGADGCARPVALVGRGHLLGLCGVLGGVTQVGAQAASAGRACALPTDALQYVMKTDPVLQAHLHQHLVQGYASLADWSQVVRVRGLPRQLMAALMLMAREQGSRTVQLPSQVALAAVLSTTRESVARALRQLHDGGYLDRIDRWHGELTGTHRHIFRDDPAR